MLIDRVADGVDGFYLILGVQIKRLHHRGQVSNGELALFHGFLQRTLHVWAGDARELALNGLHNEVLDAQQIEQLNVGTFDEMKIIDRFYCGAGLLSFDALQAFLYRLVRVVLPTANFS